MESPCTTPAGLGTLTLSDSLVSSSLLRFLSRWLLFLVLSLSANMGTASWCPLPDLSLYVPLEDRAFFDQDYFHCVFPAPRTTNFTTNATCCISPFPPLVTTCAEGISCEDPQLSDTNGSGIPPGSNCSLRCQDYSLERFGPKFVTCEATPDELSSTWSAHQECYDIFDGRECPERGPGSPAMNHMVWTRQSGFESWLDCTDVSRIGSLCKVSCEQCTHKRMGSPDFVCLRDLERYGLTSYTWVGWDGLLPTELPTCVPTPTCSGDPRPLGVTSDLTCTNGNLSLSECTVSLSSDEALYTLVGVNLTLVYPSPKIECCEGSWQVTCF